MTVLSRLVIPAQAGISHGERPARFTEIPARAGMTTS